MSSTPWTRAKNPRARERAERGKLMRTMGARRSAKRLLPVVWSALVAACGLNFDRYDPAAGTEGGADASSDSFAAEGAPADAVAQDASGDAPAGDASSGDADASDGAQPGDASSCTSGPGVVLAKTAPGPITIDGDLTDWGSPGFTVLTASNAALITGPSGTCTAANATSMCLVPAGETTDFALLRDATSLYIAVRVTVAGVGGTNTTDPYDDDAVEIYLRGDPVATGDYTSVDQQYIVDWQNLVISYGPPSAGSGQTNPPGVTSAVKLAAGHGGYVLEMQIALSEIGGSLAAGQTLGFDLGVDHGQGTAATRSFLAWWMASHGPPQCTTAKCTGCTPDEPYCDTLDFGLVCGE